MLKIIICCLVVGCAGGLGFSMAADMARRASITGEIILVIDILISEIRYGLVPLKRAFELAGERCPLGGELFLLCAGKMGAQEGITVLQAWELALNEYLPCHPLGKNEEQALRKLGPLWGRGDLESQLSALAAARDGLSLAKEQAEAEHGRLSPLFRNGGIIGGLLIVVLLF